MDGSAANVLEKLRLLESRVAELAKHPLKPFSVDPTDPLDLQRAARKLAKHVGLDDLTFIVTIAKQAKNVGGHVELRYSQREVFIELDGNLVDFPDATLAALAHEVTHKLLHHHQVWIEPSLENERLTDIAAVYAGVWPRDAQWLRGRESRNPRATSERCTGSRVAISIATSLV